ncbi:enhancer of mRNA decapping [Rhizophlyctis rosea]|uniref:Enhancer of mRNA-decapping protein 3 n=1 Tax=Rhizophlyctis rosea TaxID=64517 RepID=A0AAD5X4V5_9FUNG|nr:enhancer of mRNA decapping [Rhizophlyctis rosea]
MVTSHIEQEEEEIEYADFKPPSAGARSGQPSRSGERRVKGRSSRPTTSGDVSSGTQSPRTRGPNSPRNSPHTSGSKHRRGRRDIEAFGGDVEVMSDDFDFQAGLANFDKRQIFSEIREGDQTDPDTLLVALNKRRPYLHPLHSQKLGVHENVLDIAPSGDETGNDERESDFEYDAFVGKGADGKRVLFKTISGVPVPAVTPAEMLELDRTASTETGPSEEQMMENGGRGAAMLVLQALGGGRRIKPGNHNEGPVVVVLAGNNQTGAYGLCAARHLSNHECNVIVCVVGGEAELVNTLAIQQKIYLPTGGKLSKGIVDLPQSSQPVDLIIDALLGCHQTILDLSEADRKLVGDLMRWANDNKAPVLSLDLPSGIDGTTGQPVSPSHHINAKWTLALGLPKTAHYRAREPCGELFLADIGIPRAVFQKGLKNGRAKYVPPFGDKFLVGLELVGDNGTSVEVEGSR